MQTTGERKYKDNKGREWHVDVNATSLKRVRALTGENIGGDFVSSIQRLGADVVLLCDVLFAICEPQAKAAGVSDIDFGEALAGDALGAASDALIGALRDFIPHPAHRAIVDRVLETQAVAAERMADVIAAKIEMLPRTVERIVADAGRDMDEALGAASAGAPAGGGR